MAMSSRRTSRRSSCNASTRCALVTVTRRTDKTGKTITAGIATSRFSSKENNPKKIIAQCFSPTAAYISAKFSAIVKPIPATNKK